MQNAFVAGSRLSKGGSRHFEKIYSGRLRFPYFRTMEQNRPGLLQFDRRKTKIHLLTHAPYELSIMEKRHTDRPRSRMGTNRTSNRTDRKFLRLSCPEICAVCNILLEQ